MQNQPNSVLRRRRQRNCQSGFSLIELMVTLAVFLVISAAAFSLLTRHMPVFSSQQRQVALNFGVRNAAAQLQIDGANAGSGFYSGANITAWPLGISLVPGSGVNCHAKGSQVYTATCFDRINIVKIDTSTPIALVKDPSSGNPQNTAASAELKVTPKDPKVTMDDLASHFKENDLILVYSADLTNTHWTVARLSKDGQSAGQQVQLQHRKTNEDGTNSEEDDPFALTTTLGDKKLGSVFKDGDYVLRLVPTVYAVDSTDSSNPKLARLNSNDQDCAPLSKDGTLASAPFNPKCVMAEQVIGFKVGAQVPLDTEPEKDCKPYCYNPASYGSDWAGIRGLRITLIGRTSPTDGKEKPNTFDEGPYKIEAITVVIHPRNLSILDQSEVTKKN